MVREKNGSDSDPPNVEGTAEKARSVTRITWQAWLRSNPCPDKRDGCPRCGVGFAKALAEQALEGLTGDHS